MNVDISESFVNGPHVGSAKFESDKRKIVNVTYKWIGCKQVSRSRTKFVPP